MLQQAWEFLISFFVNFSALGFGLAVVFGAIWLACYWPPLLRKPWLWAVLIASAIITLLSISFIQVPLQNWIGQVLTYLWSQEVLMHWFLLAAVPTMLVSGLVQEGAKLVPVVIYWWRKKKNITPRLGLCVGAVAGVGFGILEAQWVHNIIFASGWTWEAVQVGGLEALAGFCERFFAVAFHVASCALAGYGLAKGTGWQFYLIVSLLHAFLNYSTIFFQSGLLTLIQMEAFVAVLAMLVTGLALWLRWKPVAEPVIIVVSKK